MYQVKVSILIDHLSKVVVNLQKVLSFFIEDDWLQLFHNLTGKGDQIKVKDVKLDKILNINKALSPVKGFN